MRLILTSRVFGDAVATEKVLRELNMDISKAKILLIATPRLPYEGPESSFESLIDWGFTTENIIIFDHNNAEEYRNLDIDIIYVTGGNTFTGLKLLKESGFDKEIIKYVNNGVIYLGKSAGTHIISKNIEHVLEFDPNEVGLTDFEALGLFDGVLVCHYSDERKECYERLLSEGKYNAYTITDEEMIEYDDSKVKELKKI